MRKYPLALAAILAMTVASMSHAGEKPPARQATSDQTKKVWTNEDLDQLRARGLISIVGPDVSQTPSQLQPATSAQGSSAHVPRWQDPAWYTQKSAELHAELEIRQAALYVQQTAMSLASDRITEPGVAMYRSNAGVTPASALANLQARVDEVQNEIDQLGELARVNGIAPGTLQS